MGVDGDFLQISDRQARRRMQALLKKHGAVIRYKDESAWMRCLGALMFWSPRFSKHMSTVIGKTVWLPSREWAKADEMRTWIVLAHELVHVADAAKVSGLVFSLAYLFPQCLALLAPLALVPGFEMMWYCMAFALPIPAPFRAWIEYRGYAAQLACCYWRRLQLGAPIENISRQFTGGSYFFMWPFSGMVESRANKVRRDIITCKLREEMPIVAEIHKALQP